MENELVGIQLPSKMAAYQPYSNFFKLSAINFNDISIKF